MLQAPEYVNSAPQSEHEQEGPQDILEFPEDDMIPLHHQEYLDMYEADEQQEVEQVISDARDQGEEMYDYMMTHRRISTVLTGETIREVEEEQELLEEGWEC